MQAQVFLILETLWKFLIMIKWHQNRMRINGYFIGEFQVWFKKSNSEGLVVRFSSSPSIALKCYYQISLRLIKVSFNFTFFVWKLSCSLIYIKVRLRNLSPKGSFLLFFFFYMHKMNCVVNKPHQIVVPV